MKSIFNHLFLSSFFYQVFGGIVGLFILGFAVPFIFPIAQTALVLAIALTLADLFLLFNKNVIFQAQRNLPKTFSLGNHQKVSLNIKNSGNRSFQVELIDELPIQMQEREQSFKLLLKPNDEKRITYPFRPLTRGSYEFGNVHFFLKSFLRLLVRRYTIPQEQAIPVYPSIIDMKHFELITLSKISFSEGVKKIRRIGQSHEFEQIKNYAMGDDFQRINWKASSRGMGLMVNHYEDERAQQVYAIIDKSRNMKMPFDGMTLLDYAINSALVISNTSLQKHDRMGLFTFSEKVDTILKANKNRVQLRKILEALYNEAEGTADANYELMYNILRKTITSRSLLFLYTNFESLYAMQRVLPLIRKINRQHLLVVVIFQNTELIQYTTEPAQDIEEIYFKTLAQKLNFDKKEVVKELNKFGIQTIYTTPQNLSLNVINKYLELKSRGLI